MRQRLVLGLVLVYIGLGAAGPARGQTITAQGVLYPAGWNIVPGSGVPIMDAVGPLYTLRGGDSAYQVISSASALDPFRGYWAYFSEPTVQPQPHSGPFTTISLPPGQWVMIGVPTYTIPGGLRGADLIYRYNPSTQSYERVSNLQPGEGGWALSYAGGCLTFQPTIGVGSLPVAPCQ